MSFFDAIPQEMIIGFPVLAIDFMSGKKSISDEAILKAGTKSFRKETAFT
tara:strand:+ start:597 stop:746 length:150 start_codon:yes stop_codon:yes gene_type:complete